jgi:6-phosphogluconolactonase
MTRRLSRGAFLAGGAALGLAGLMPAFAEGSLDGAGARPVGGHLGASASGRTTEYFFDYPGREEVYTIELQVLPDNQAVLDNAGFRVYGPGGSVHVTGGAQRGLRPNVVANVIGVNRGRHVVQVYNYNREVAVDYQIRLVRGRQEGQEVAPVAAFSEAAGAPLLVYVGTQTDEPRKGEGIYVYRMDPSNGALTRQSVTRTRNPGFLAIDPSQRFLYAAQTGVNAIGAYAVDQASGDLTPINMASAGAPPTHLSVDPTGRCVVSASWNTGTVTLNPVGPDGGVGEPLQVVKHEGPLPGPHPDQSQARAHQSPFDPSGRWVLVNDLGLDRVYIYGLDAAAGKLVSSASPFAQVGRGRGPRHLSFHPNGRWVYVIDELDSSLTVLSFDAEKGILQEVQHRSTLPPDYDGRRWSAQVVVHPSGRWVYASNRAIDNIVQMAIDPESGRVAPVGWTPSGGRTVRNFNVDPSGRFLIAAHQDGASLVPFSIDQETGALTPTGQVVAVESPICVLFAPGVGLG